MKKLIFLCCFILFGCSQFPGREAIEAHQTLVTRLKLEQGWQKFENQIFELKKKNEAFDSHLEQLKQEHTTINNEIEAEINKPENSLESLQERFKAEKKLFKDYLDKLQLEINNPTHVPETPITSDAQEFTTKLANLYENLNLEELIHVLHETEIELSYLRSQKLPQSVAHYLSLREAVLSQYLNEDGIITFLLDTPEFFPIGTLQSDKNTPEGLEIRYQINRGIIAYHNVQAQLAEEDLEKKSLLVAACGFLQGADTAVYEGNVQSAWELLHLAGSNIDTVIKKK